MWANFDVFEILHERPSRQLAKGKESSAYLETVQEGWNEKPGKILEAVAFLPGNRWKSGKNDGNIVG